MIGRSRLARAGALLASAAFAANLVATRRGWSGGGGGSVAAFGALVLVASGVALAFALRRLLAERRGRVASVAEATLFLGLTATALAGLGRWAFGAQGAAVLTTGEQVVVAHGHGLAEATFGPLARSDALSGRIRLLEVDLRPDGEGGFLPASVLSVGEEGREDRIVEISPASTVLLGEMRLHQGAFGFAPRLVLRKGERILFDETVHFTSRRVGARGVAFEGEFAVRGEGLEVVSVVELTGLDERMKGHPTLVVGVRRGEVALGKGSLRPGFSATMDDGYEITFAGMKMWSEIDLRRATSSLPPLVGMLLALLGGLTWPVAAWRRW